MFTTTSPRGSSYFPQVWRSSAPLSGVARSPRLLPADNSAAASAATGLRLGLAEMGTVSILPMDLVGAGDGPALRRHDKRFRDQEHWVWRGHGGVGRRVGTARGRGHDLPGLGVLPKRVQLGQQGSEALLDDAQELVLERLPRAKSPVALRGLLPQEVPAGLGARAALGGRGHQRRREQGQRVEDAEQRGVPGVRRHGGGGLGDAVRAQHGVQEGVRPRAHREADGGSTAGCGQGCRPGVHSTPRAALRAESWSQASLKRSRTSG